jgi:hypothetical protein
MPGHWTHSYLSLVEDSKQQSLRVLASGLARKSSRWGMVVVISAVSGSHVRGNVCVVMSTVNDPWSSSLMVFVS